MQKLMRYILKEMGINQFLAVKNIYYKNSEGLYSVYDSIKTATHYKHSKEKIVSDLIWTLNTVKDFAQYNY